MKREKKLSTTVIVIICVLAFSIVAYAAILLFASDSETSQNTKGEYFEIDLTAGMTPTEVIPGGSFSVKPEVKNKATSEMYVFIAVETPSVDSSSLYGYTISEGWSLVESSAEKAVYAYAGTDGMTTLALDETTSELTTQMTMKEISNAEYVGLDDINVTITGYGIGTDDVSTDPAEAWTYCKQVGNIE